MGKTYSIEDIFKETSSYIYSLSYRLTGSRDEAGDLMQETYLRAMQKLHQVRDAGNPLPWLRKICLNIFLDKNKKSGARYGMKETVFPADDHYIASNELTPEQEVVFDEDVQKIRSQCYSILSSTLCLNQRIAFVLVDIFRLDADEVSEIMNRSRSSVKSLLFRAREKMSRRLSPSCGLVDPDNICRCRSWIAFAHDVGKRREHLAEILEQKNPHADTRTAKDRLRMLFNALPYLRPPEWNPDEFQEP